MGDRAAAGCKWKAKIGTGNNLRRHGSCLLQHKVEVLKQIKTKQGMVGGTRYAALITSQTCGYFDHVQKTSKNTRPIPHESSTNGRFSTQNAPDTIGGKTTPATWSFDVTWHLKNHFERLKAFSHCTMETKDTLIPANKRPRLQNVPQTNCALKSAGYHS